MPLDREKNQRVLRARALRREMTLPEILLWRELRARPGGFKFRRQHPLGRFVVDFYCAKAKLVIEVDGEAHSIGDQPAYDAQRDAWLSGRGPRVIRVLARDATTDLASVIVQIVLDCRRRLPLHHASHGSPPHDFVAGRN